MKYRVTTYEKVTRYWSVEASSQEEAVELTMCGEAEPENFMDIHHREVDEVILDTDQAE